MPGCIIDRYNNVIVMQFHSVGMWKLKEIFSKAIAKNCLKLMLFMIKVKIHYPKF